MQAVQGRHQGLLRVQAVEHQPDVVDAARLGGLVPGVVQQSGQGTHIRGPQELALELASGELEQAEQLDLSGGGHLLHEVGQLILVLFGRPN